MMNKKQISIVFLSALIVLSIFTSCSSANKSESNKISDIKWITIGEQPADHSIVLDEINKYIGDKLKIKLDLVFLPEIDYLSKVNSIISSGEKFDILWTSGENKTFSNKFIRDKFLDITNIINEKATGLKSLIPKEFWSTVTVDGKIYGIPTYKDSSESNYYIYDKEYVDKYSIDYNNINDMISLGPVLKKIKENEKEIYPFSLTKSGYTGIFDGYDLISQSPPIGINIKSKNDYIIRNPYEQDEVIEKLTILNSWYNQQFINKDANHTTEYKDNLIITAVEGYPTYEVEIGDKLKKSFVSSKFDGNYYTNNSIRESVNVISKDSANPNKAVSLLNAVNTESKLRNLFAYGIEGVHFKKTTDTTIEILANGYKPDVFKQATLFNLYSFPPYPENKWELIKKENLGAVSSPILGFIPKFDGLEDKLENCSKVYEKWKSHINTGSQNPVESVPKLLGELNSNGYKEIVLELQKQLDEFMKSKS